MMLSGTGSIMHSIDRRAILRSVGALGLPAALARPSQAAAFAAPASVQTMRFTKYEVFPTHIPMAERVREAWIESYRLQGTFQTHYDPVFVRLHTDVGISGIGESLMSAAQTEAALKRMVGRSPWEYLMDDSISGILMAVYDVLGKATGMPACRLMASSPKPRVFHTYWTHCLPPKLMAQEAKLGASLGYRVHKVKARPWQDPIEQAAAMCEVVPKEYRFWVDANYHWGSPSRALFFIQKLAQFHNYFAAESPITGHDLAGYRQLKGKSPLKLADHPGPDIMPFVREELLQAWVIGGPLGRSMAQKALTAEVTGIPLWVEYGTQSGIAQVFQAHQAAAYPGIEFTITVTHCLEDDIMVEPFTMESGYYRVPQKPGIGVTLDENAMEKYRVKA